MMSDGDKVLVGKNEDNNIPYTRVWFIPAENGQYGRVYFGYENWFPQGGMNDQGLFFDFFATKPLQTIVLAAYYQQKLVITAITTLARPEFFNDCIYSFSFE